MIHFQVILLFASFIGHCSQICNYEIFLYAFTRVKPYDLLLAIKMIVMIIFFKAHTFAILSHNIGRDVLFVLFCDIGPNATNSWAHNHTQSKVSSLV